MSLLPLPYRTGVVITFAVSVLTACGGVPEVTESSVDTVSLVQDEQGTRLVVGDEDFFVMGMNWDYYPIGTNYAYSLWEQDDDIIREALDREMSSLRGAGINAIRQYVGVPPRWVAYIHENYGIYTILNHAMGRYGVMVDKQWRANTDYADPASREVILSEITAMVEQFQDTPGVLMWLLGNENNYGLVWSGAETENLPEEELNYRLATPLYTLFGEAAERIKRLDTHRPVAMANGDLGYLDLIVEHAQAVDIFGTNVYRGIGFTDAFDRIRDEFGKPIFFTEFGSDAFNAKEEREDQLMQARYLKGQWRQIYDNASGLSGSDNAIGGLTFQWSDGWWKYGQETGLDVHDSNASWHNAGYPEDYVEGKNNMNEEWFGVVAKGPTDERQQFELIPRGAYYTLMQIHELNPYGPNVTPAVIADHFAGISPQTDVRRAAQEGPVNAQ